MSVRYLITYRQTRFIDFLRTSSTADIRPVTDDFPHAIIISLSPTPRSALTTGSDLRIEVGPYF